MAIVELASRLCFHIHSIIHSIHRHFTHSPAFCVSEIIIVAFLSPSVLFFMWCPSTIKIVNAMTNLEYIPPERLLCEDHHHEYLACLDVLCMLLLTNK